MQHRYSWRKPNSSILSKTLIDPSLKGMGTTVSMVTLARHMAFWGHVGDSRIYLYRDGEFKQISVDHTIVQVLLEKGKITEEEAMDHPQRHVLTRAVGIDENLVVDSGAFEVQPKDRILICSDGLTSFIQKQELYDAIGDYRRTEREIINDLFARVYENGAKDNITTVCRLTEIEARPQVTIPIIKSCDKKKPVSSGGK